MLEVMLTTANEEATKLFTPAIQNNKTTVTYSSGVASKNGFLVDQNGYIELPFIGKIMAHGKKRNVLEDEIENAVLILLMSAPKSSKVFKLILYFFQSPFIFNSILF